MTGPAKENSRESSSHATTEPAIASRLPWLLLTAVILVATFAAYMPAIPGKFLWDDDAHVTKPELRSVDGLARIWFEPGATEQYYPVLHSVFWLEYHCWGDASIGYHLANIFWHAGSSVLFLLVLRRLRLRGAELAALIFALHPVCVESVAWVAEQKNTLSTFFYLAAALAYWRWRAAPGFLRNYFLASGLFVLALLSKSVTATLPAALLVIAWWRNGRLSGRDDIRPLLPWFGASVAVGFFTAWVERTYIGAEGASFDLSVAQRVIVAGRAIWFYLGKLLWPVELVFVYPKWNIDPRNGWSYGYAAGVMLLVGLFWRLRLKNRGPLTVALLFIGTLVPVLGFLNVYGSRFSYVTDHWEYLPSLSIIAIMALGVMRVTDLAPQHWRGIAAAVAAVTLPLTLAGLTWNQSHRYRDPIALFESVLEKNPGCQMAHNNLGVELVQAGRTPEAIAHFEAALRETPDYARAQLNLADALAGAGRSNEALVHYAWAVRVEPTNAGAHANYGDALAENGQLEAAIRELRLAVMLGEPNAETDNSLGTALFQTQHTAEALAQYRAALRLAPDFVPARRNLANALFALGRVDEALVEYEVWLKQQPDSADANNLAGIALARLGRMSEARARFERAAQLDPHDEEIPANLNRVRSQLRTQ